MSEEVSTIAGWIDIIEKDYIKLKQQLTEISAERDEIANERDDLANQLKRCQTNERLTSLQLQLTQDKLEEYFVNNQKKNALLTAHCEQQKKIIHLVASKFSIAGTNK